jgi:hypothetical protein
VGELGCPGHVQAGSAAAHRVNQVVVADRAPARRLDRFGEAGEAGGGGDAAHGCDLAGGDVERHGANGLVAEQEEDGGGAVDLICWTQHLVLHGDLAKAEPKTLRYRLLHVAARLTRQRRIWLRIQRSWPWARDLAAAFARLAALPVPAG